ncbi:MAG: D-alanine--D-alanine ligase family protein [Ancrocorticia sp.]|uniref:D-alanine--D-alanine ligase family protein n=1 Tax=Ancrocorticia sp. TaxID=2593684 RepID=UPI003F91A4CD
MTARIRVALIYGGASGEHSVSCLTAASVMRAMDPAKYEVLPIGIRKDGTWVPGTVDPEELEAAGPHGEVPESPDRMVIGSGEDGCVVYHVGTERVDAYAVDVAFPLLHGPFGEDGTIQGLLEIAGLPYVGAGVFASAAGMDKHYMKVVLEAASLPVVPYVLATSKRWRHERDAVIKEAEETLTWPVFVKPARAGSSLGITRVERAQDLPAAVKTAQDVDPKVLIEQGVAGREIECAVLGGHGDDSARASVLGEIALDTEWYDYETKYVETEGFHMEIPANITGEAAESMQSMAVEVFDAFECEGMTRVDFFLAESGEIFVNEHNTIPGFTAFSMYPVLWEKTGLEYPKLIDELVDLALERPIGLR